MSRPSPSGPCERTCATGQKEHNATGEQQKLGTGGVGAAGDTVGQHTHGRDGETGAR